MYSSFDRIEKIQESNDIQISVVPPNPLLGPGVEFGQLKLSSKGLLCIINLV